MKTARRQRGLEVASITPEVRTDALKALSREKCLGCWGAKLRGHVFCRACYWRLPPEVQKGLYKPLGSGAYVEAYATALARLRPDAVVYELS